MNGHDYPELFEPDEDERDDYGPQEPPDDERIFNRRQADGTYRPLAEFFQTPTADEREYLDALDAVYEDAFTPSYDEWLAIRLRTGMNPADFSTYLHEINAAGDRRYRDALVYFRAIDEGEGQ